MKVNAVLIVIVAFFLVTGPALANGDPLRTLTAQPAAAIYHQWSSLGGANTGLNYEVFDIEFDGGVLYAGGWFTDAGGVLDADYIAQFSGGAWSALGGDSPDLNNVVADIYISGGVLYASGWFTDAGGDQYADGIAQFSGGAWSSLGGENTGLNSYVFDILSSGGALYAGGAFYDAGGDSDADSVAQFGAGAWSSLGTNNGLDGTIIYDLELDGGVLYAAGNFQDAGGDVNADRIAKFSGGVWSSLGGGNTGLDDTVRDLEISGGVLYAAGYFADAGGDVNADRIAKFSGGAWSSLGGGNTGLSGGVHDIEFDGGVLYAGGWFTDAGGVLDADYIAQFSGGAWSSLGGITGLNGGVYDLEFDGGVLYAVGNFTDSGGDPDADYIAQLGLIPPPDPTYSSDPLADSTLAFSGSTGSTPAVQIISVSNIGVAGSLLDVAEVAVTPGYTILEGLPIDDLQPGAAVEIKVQCDSVPQGAGPLVLSTNDIATPAVTFNLTCTATDPTFSSDPLADSTLAFSGSTGSTPAVQIISVSNIGAAGSLLDVAEVAVTPGYTILEGLPIDDLQPGAAVEIKVQCDSVPQGAGPLVLSTNDIATPAVTFNLTCTATDPTFSSDPLADSTLAFSGSTGSTPAVQIISVSNIGAAGSLLDVAEVAVTPGYTILEGLPIDDLQPGAAVEIKVQCDSVPQVAGQLVLSTNDTATPVVTFNLTCSATAPLPSMPDLIAPLNNALTTDYTPLFDWDAAANAQDYQIQVSTVVDFTTTVINQFDVVASEFTPASNLSDRTTYFWRVCGFNTDNDPGPWSEIRVLHTAYLAPNLSAPANNALLTDRTPLLKWAAVTGAANYTLQVSMQSNFSSLVINATVTGTQYAVPSNLAANAKYFWRVRAFAGQYGPGNWSETRAFREAILPPGLQTPKNNAKLTDTTPAFNWKDVAGANGYTIQISRQANFAKLLKQANVTRSDYTIPSNLPKNVVIYWRVQAKGANGPSDWSQVWKFTIK